MLSRNASRWLPRQSRKPSTPPDRITGVSRTLRNGDRRTEAPPRLELVFAGIPAAGVRETHVTVCSSACWIGAEPDNDWVAPEQAGARLEPWHCLVYPTGAGFALVSFHQGGLRVNDRAAPLPPGLAYTIADGDILHLPGLSLHATVRGARGSIGTGRLAQCCDAPATDIAAAHPDWLHRVCSSEPLAAVQLPRFAAASGTVFPDSVAAADGALASTPPFATDLAIAPPGAAALAGGPATQKSAGESTPQQTLEATRRLISSVAEAVLPEHGRQTVRAALEHVDASDPEGAVMRLQAVGELVLTALRSQGAAKGKEAS